MALLATLLLGALASPPTSPWENEIIYQVFPRSFYDSNGDRIGDFNGLAQKLPYIKGLGATAILLQPIQKSRLYHNYFPDDYFTADPSFGTNAQFFDMVHAAHRLGLKVVLDMEQQYVASLHPWYVAAKDHPDSPEAKRVLWKSGFFTFRELPTYDRQRIPIATINTNDPEVLATVQKDYLFWAAPPNRPRDGVDGFRIDHMMDDLDFKHENTNMLAGFWLPIERAVKRVKPKTFFVAEQSDWRTLGTEQFNQGGVDAVYAIPLRSALITLDAPKIDQALRDEQQATPPGRTQLLIVEDHDVERYASVVDSDSNLERLGAVAMLTIKGTPSIYYGQELGMKGIQVHGRDDGNDIPVRLAFRWNKSLDAPGTATWYGAGPWANPAFTTSGDGISVEEEENDPGSLLSFYRKLISIRRHSKALSVGEMHFPAGTPRNLVSYERNYGDERVLVALNYGDTSSQILIPGGQNRAKDLLSGRPVPPGALDVPPHGFRLTQLVR